MENHTGRGSLESNTPARHRDSSGACRAVGRRPGSAGGSGENGSNAPVAISILTAPGWRSRPTSRGSPRIALLTPSPSQNSEPLPQASATGSPRSSSMLSWIDGSLYPDRAVPATIDSLAERVDFIARLCGAWDFGVLPGRETITEIRRSDWREAVDATRLLTSPSY